MRREGTPLNEAQCAKIIKGVLTGLKYMHEEKNLIHRDLKPDNIMMKSYERLDHCVLIDFGLAINYENEILDFPECGTLLYKPPE
mmetsp:Transcript_63478/g.87681  ORF Transcript_63478/g.87681 Transcript_63478/m.87681 type:complete len:85 (+) Transcript_63478:43-297(+)